MNNVFYDTIKNKGITMELQLIQISVAKTYEKKMKSISKGSNLKLHMILRKWRIEMSFSLH